MKHPDICIVCGEAAVPDTLLCTHHHLIYKQTPCKDCTERHRLCQSTCTKHAEKLQVVHAVKARSLQHKMCIPRYIPPKVKPKSKCKPH